ncbi:MAG: hypothetical protein C5B59_18635, partial [Bacteroidetes bacterium]
MGQTIQDFVPQHWKIEDSVTGDLNHDYRFDWGIMLVCDDSVKKTNQSGGIKETIFVHPRILAILLRDDSMKCLRLLDENHKFVPGFSDLKYLDPYEGIEIRDGIFKINITWNYGAAHDALTYSFRYQSGQFVLIGAESNYYNPAIREGRDRSFNFLTKKWKEQNVIESSTKNSSKEIWHSLQLKKPKT